MVNSAQRKNQIYVSSKSKAKVQKVCPAGSLPEEYGGTYSTSLGALETKSVQRIEAELIGTSVHV